MAIASLVCSLVGVIPCFWLFQIMGLLGTIFGFVGLKQTKNGRRPGRGLAMAGVIIGIVLVVACRLSGSTSRPTPTACAAAAAGIALRTDAWSCSK